MISNPIQGTIYDKDGCPQYVKFTYSKAFAKKAFNFQPADCGLSSSREANLLFFALNEKHALKRLKKMLEWYLENNPDDPRLEFKPHELVTQGRTRLKRKYAKHWLDNWDKVKVVEVSLDQFFKVGWADNDTML